MQLTNLKHSNYYIFLFYILSAMSVIIVLIAFSLVVAIIFLIAFIWAVKSGQYEDDYTPSVRILFEDSKKDDSSTEESEGQEINSETKNKNQNKNYGN